MRRDKTSLVSVSICIALSALFGGAFLAVTLGGDYNWTARIGGTLWVFLLSMIVLLPVVMPAVKKRSGT